MKDKAASTLYNSYVTAKVMPRPGAKAKGEADKTAPYILNTPTFKEQVVSQICPMSSTSPMPSMSSVPSKPFHRGAEQVVEGEGFVIVGCDGVWDEMSSEEAVGIVANLLIDYAEQPDADIATLFVDEVLRKAAERIAESYEVRVPTIYLAPPYSCMDHK